MIAPLVPYAIRGVTWYQGETNAIFGWSWQYRWLLPALIRDWRAAWGQGEFPLLYVQLANHQDVQCEPADDLWAELREAQRLALSEPNVAMVVTIDLGERWNIHPRNERDVGERLALAALGKAYGRDVCYSGPMYRSLRREGDSIRLLFDYTDGGLVAKDGSPRGFVIAGEDRRFCAVEARIDGPTVLVCAPGITHPVAVRYAWAADPPCSLYNGAGLPASPFRTDDWPLVSQMNR